MIGETVSHYRILEKLGGGGMGVVYKAIDLRLDRFIALKFLPPELTRDEEANKRFVQEAKAASALDHPNICTIHEIDQTPSGQVFLVLTYYEGETLKKRLDRGPLAVEDAIEIAIQAAQGLAAAHESGIVHRDIKPANLMLTRGVTKILDFGVAKLTGQTSVTRTGSVVGTPAYMSPEQIRGEPLDQRSDIWSLGIVLYEMLTGARPFPGSEAIVLNTILSGALRPIGSLREGLPPDLPRIIGRALEKDCSRRYDSAVDLLNDLRGCQATLTQRSGTVDLRTSQVRPVVGVVNTLKAALRKPVLVVSALLVLGLAVGFTGWWWNQGAERRWVQEEGIPEATKLIEQDQYAAALAILTRIERITPENPTLQELWTKAAVPRSIDTDPPGADVYIKGYADIDGAWEYIGRTPMAAARLPVGVFRWRIQKDGYDTLEFIISNQFIPATGQQFSLAAARSTPSNMLLVPRSNLGLTLPGYNDLIRFPAEPFFIDKYEVTNRQFKEFVDAGGYADRQFWKHEFSKNGRVVSWEDAVAEFRDRTGRPGPSTWEVGTYPQGQDDYPVSGVSWYEAEAYAEFAGKSLPTVYHWLRAAGVNFAGYIAPLSNLEGKGPVPAGSTLAVSPVGALDMAGNVKEWCWNEMAGEGTRYILGGSWSDPLYAFIWADARSAFDRSETNGFRLVKYQDSKPLAAPLTEPLKPAASRDYRKEQPVSDELFRAYKEQYSYDPTPLDATRESVETGEQWVKEKVSFRTAYASERIIAYLFLPKNVQPPFQTLVYVPNVAAVVARSSETLVNLAIIDFLMTSGRAVLYPVYKGTYERNSGQTSWFPDMTQGYRNWITQVVVDVRRSVDYLETRTDIRRDQIGYFGQSWGAILGSIVLGVEPRLRAAVFLSGGFYTAPSPPAVDPFNFARHVSVPVLMLNGDNDYITPVNESQVHLHTLLGSLQKRYRTFTGGHGGFWSDSRNQMIKESLDWLDRYLGPVKSAGLH